jgi:phage terminase large subunit
MVDVYGFIMSDLDEISPQDYCKRVLCGETGCKFVCSSCRKVRKIKSIIKVHKEALDNASLEECYAEKAQAKRKAVRDLACDFATECA